MILEETQLYGQGVCAHCGRVGDGHSLRCKTLQMEKGWVLRIPFEFSDDPFEAAWERMHA